MSDYQEKQAQMKQQSTEIKEGVYPRIITNDPEEAARMGWEYEPAPGSVVTGFQLGQVLDDMRRKAGRCHYCGAKAHWVDGRGYIVDDHKADCAGLRLLSADIFDEDLQG